MERTIGRDERFLSFPVNLSIVYGNLTRLLSQPCIIDRFMKKCREHRKLYVQSINVRESTVSTVITLTSLVRTLKFRKKYKNVFQIFFNYTNK